MVPFEDKKIGQPGKISFEFINVKSGQLSILHSLRFGRKGLEKWKAKVFPEAVLEFIKNILHDFPSQFYKSCFYYCNFAENFGHKKIFPHVYVISVFQFNNKFITYIVFSQSKLLHSGTTG